MTHRFTKQELMNLSGLDGGALFYCGQQGLIRPVGSVSRGTRPVYDLDAVLQAILLGSVQGRGASYKDAADDVGRLREKGDFWSNMKRFAATHEVWVTIIDAADDVTDEVEAGTTPEGRAFADWIATRNGRLGVEIFDPGAFEGPIWHLTLRNRDQRRHLKAVSFINVTRAVRRAVVLAS